MTELGLRVVVPAAGLGTRMLPATKEQPKEMLPIFSNTSSGEMCVKPVLHLVFEQLYQFGLREFCMVVGRDKRAIEDYFTPDTKNVSDLKSSGKNEVAIELENFYEKILTSKIAWINQPAPRGFGDAVLQCQWWVGQSNMLVHAGDTCFFSDGSHLDRLLSDFSNHGADAAFIVKRVANPQQFGVISFELGDDILRVTDAVEKPTKPQSDYAIMPVYIFKPMIFDFLGQVKPDEKGEIQLTAGIKGMIDAGKRVIATCLTEKELWLDIGTPQTYWEALKTSHDLQLEKNKKH
jgi:UTP--glucose-1-phosphate uridylyltransferase